MTNRYYIKRGDFFNTYSLRYAPAEFPIPEGYEQITRREAEAYARAEAQRRRDDANFAYYADAYVYPFGMSEDDEYRFECRFGWHTEGRLAVRGR